MTAKQSASTIGTIDLVDGADSTRPAAGIFRELRIAGLKEDFHAVQGRHDGFGGAGCDTTCHAGADDIFGGLARDLPRTVGGGLGRRGGEGGRWVVLCRIVCGGRCHLRWFVGRGCVLGILDMHVDIGVHHERVDCLLFGGYPQPRNASSVSLEVQVVIL